MSSADARVEQAQVVHHFGHGPHRRARILGNGLLLNSDGRTQTADEIDLWLLDLL